MKLIIDVSSILGAFMHLEDKEFGEDITVDGKAWHVPSLEVCMERAFDSLESVLHEHSFRYTDCILVKDQSGTGAARKKLCPEYKSGRGKRPEQFYKVMNALVEEFCEGCMRKGSVTAVSTQVPQTEADDLISEIVTRFPETTIWSRDRDMLAFPATHHIIDRELDPVRYPVPRGLIVLYRCLVTGDTSDGIKSCKGFGEKAWLELKQLIGWPGLHELDKMFQEKRLHELAEDVPHMKKLQLLIDQAEDLYMSYKLMQPMHVPAHKVRWSARVTDCSKVLVTADNFERCKGEIELALQKHETVVLDFETDICDEARAWIEQTGGDVKVDVMGSEICGGGVKIGDQSWYLSVDHRDTNNIKLCEFESVLLLFKDRKVYMHNAGGFENPVMLKTFGWMFENAVDTRIYASYCDENEFAGLKLLSKKWLGYDQQSYESTLAQAAEESGIEVRGMRDVSGEQVLEYGLDDTITTDSLHYLFECMMLYEKTLGVFNEVEPDSLLAFSMAFVRGINFDWGVYHRLKGENDANTARAKAELESMLLEVGWGESVFKPFLVLTGKTVKELYQMVMGYELETKARSVGSVVEAIESEEANEKINSIISAVSEGIEAVNALAERYWVPRAELNTRSPTQVKTLLYDVLNCPVRIRNPATDVMRKKGIWEGNPSTDDDAVNNAISWKDTTEEGIAVLKKLVELKGYLTRESLFLSKWPKHVHWKTGKIHCNQTQSATSTRRFSHSNVNLAQLPKKKGKEVRDLISAPEDYYILSMDFNSQELLLQAWDSQCPRFLAAYTGEIWDDIHSITGYEIAVKQGADVGDYNNFIINKDKDIGVEGSTKAFRNSGKGTNFTSTYLAKAKKIAQKLCVTEAEAQTFLDSKFAAFPGLMPHIEQWNDLCMKRGYSLTFMGARRHLHKQFGMAKSQGEVDSAKRLSWSFRVQGSAAEMTKLAIGKCWRSGCIDELCWCFGAIHDEANFYIHKSILEERLPILLDCITGYYSTMEIKPRTTPEVGTHFGSLKKIILDKDK